MTKRLILFTSGFPFGNSEPFLETEIEYLSNTFDEVVIFCPNVKDQNKRLLPSNCKVQTFSIELSLFDKLCASFGILSSIFWKECKIIKKVYLKNLTFGILKTMVISLYQGRRIERLCQKQVIRDSKEDKTTFYSYWCDDTALGLALFQHKNERYKCISRTHGWDVYFEVSSVNYLPFRHFIADHLTALFPISEKGKSYISETWKIAANSRVQVARLGVKQQDYAICKFPVFTIVSCSNMIPLKRIHLIIDALAEIQSNEIQWVHFGDGPQMNELVAYANHKLPKNISVDFKGRVSNLVLMDWYRQHQPDVFINVSSSEGIPVSIMEAMSFGIPAIATNVGGTAELVNEENGCLLPANPQVQQIENAMRYFVSLSKENQMKFSDKAKFKWEQDFNARSNYELFCSQLV